MAKLSKAPVFYVVAQVNHSPVLKLDSLVSDLQEIVRKEGFPGYRTFVQNQTLFQIERSGDGALQPRIENSVSTSHIFSSRDQSQSLIVNQDNFFLQTVEYETIDDFKKLFAICIQAIQKILSPDSFTRIGLRFLDAITPPVDGELSHYIKKQFLGLQDILPNNWSTVYTFSETLLNREDQQTKVRVLTRASGFEMPTDLLQIAPPLPERFARISGVHAILDSDVSFTAMTAERFDEQTILGRLTRLKRDIRDSFHASVTDAALEDWA